MFGREFPFNDLLGVWDTLFAEDPELDLVDLICVAMLLKIHWQRMNLLLLTIGIWLANLIKISDGIKLLIRPHAVAQI